MTNAGVRRPGYEARCQDGLSNEPSPGNLLKGCFLILIYTEKQIDLESVDLKKLRVKELKKILNTWDEDCRGCAEKSDYISKINEVKHLHLEL